MEVDLGAAQTFATEFSGSSRAQNLKLHIFIQVFDKNLWKFISKTQFSKAICLEIGQIFSVQIRRNFATGGGGRGEQYYL